MCWPGAAPASGIQAAVRSGDVVRVERGLLAVSGADPELVAAGRSRGLLTCVSAAPRFGLWQLRPAAQPHYWHSNGRNAVQCISHRLALTRPQRHGTLAALPDVLLHALLCLPPLESLAMVECAYNRGDIDPFFLRRHLVGNRCGKARDVLARVEQGADRCGTCWPGGRSAGRSRTSPVLELPAGRRGRDAVTEGSKLGQSAGQTRSSGPG